MSQPNLLFIMTDQQRLSGVGAYGPTPCLTPNIDRLAGEGTLFRHAYTACPVCSPARATVMTGQFPHAHGITSNIHETSSSVHELPDSPHLLPRRLQAAGYRTGHAGEWHLGTAGGTTPSRLGLEGPDLLLGGDGRRNPQYVAWLKEKGLEHKIKPWAEKTKKVRAAFAVLDLPPEATVPYYLVDQSIGLIEGWRRGDKPWFMSLNFWGPHAPYFATEEWVRRYRGRSIPPWPNFDWDSRGTPGPHHYKVHWDKESLNWDDWAMALRYYYARISMIDEQIGRLYAYLEETGLLESTAIIFTADHGQTLGSHGGMLDKGWSHFEEIQRVPLILRQPGAADAGTVREEFASLVDVYPTLMDLAGQSPAGTDGAPVHGRSLLPLARGESVAWRDAVVTEFLGLDNIAACLKTIRVGDLKYGYNSAWRGELYDLKADPHETRNLVDDPRYADRLGEMRDRLEQWMEETGDRALRMYRWQRQKHPDKR